MRSLNCLALIVSIVSFAMTPVRSFAEQQVIEIGPTPTMRAVIVDDVALVHTRQVLPQDRPTTMPVPQNIDEQFFLVAEELMSTLGVMGDVSSVVKLNVYVSKLDSISAIDRILAAPMDRPLFTSRPAVSYVVTPLPGNALVGMDAVAVAKSSPQSVSSNPELAVMPKGSRIYISGQAEKGGTLAEATRNTLQSLSKTLRFLGRQDSDIVQLKSFLSPMANVDEARKEFVAFFGDRPVPPTVWVEWQSPLIEIELIAWGGEKKSGPAVEFITPPGMTASPVYSRVARTNSDRLIYLSGLYSRTATDAAGEVVDIFDQLANATQKTGSDLKHLVKATYYCSNNDTSTKLNELRPKYYDPKRPPAASKALVAGVGRAERGLTIDMIAVPVEK